MNTPIKNMLDDFDKQNYNRFFMPGHKGKINLTLSHDITEVLNSDDLSCPTGAIKQANDLLKDAYNMDYASMITCGSTVGVFAMLLCKKGKILFGRDAHKSCINACFCFEFECEIFKDTSTKGYLNAIEKTDAKTLYITYPNYNGTAIDIELVCKKAKEKDMLIIVDFAHGAAFAYSDNLPTVPHMADMFCTSSHKTLPTLTQGAIVFAKRQYKDILHKNLFTIHTTSPSYLIMESIDSSRDFMQSNQDLIEKWIQKCKSLKLDADILKTQDPTRITLSVEGYTGYELFDIFANQGIIGEMADMKYLVFITSPLDLASIDKLQTVKIPKKSPKQLPTIAYGKEFESIHYTKNKPTKSIHYKQASGKICASVVGAYPPGSACVLPGEIITDQVITYLSNVLNYGGHIFGMEEGYTIKVIDN